MRPGRLVSLLSAATTISMLAGACVGEDPASTARASDAGDGDRAAPPNDGGAGDAGDADVTAPFTPSTPSVATSANHACALAASGDVWCWGADGYGQAGVDPSSAADCSGQRCVAPTKVPDLPRARAIAAGAGTTYIIDEDGGVWSWGRNDNRQLGYDTTATCTVPGEGTLPCQTKPKKVDAVPVVKQIEAGLNWACAQQTTNGAVWCWGTNQGGECGQTPTTPTPLAPAPVSPPLNDGATQIATGYFGYAAAVKANKAFTWAVAVEGALGRPTTSPGCSNSFICEPIAAPVRSGDGNADLIGIAEVRMANAFGFARTTDRKVYVWGSGRYGLLHDGDATESDTHRFPFAQLVADLPSADAIYAKNDVACLLSGTDLHCWGANQFGQTGAGAGPHECANGPTPCAGKARKVPLPGAVRHAATGSSFVVALLANGDVYAWGRSLVGQLGRLPAGPDAGDGFDPVPTKVPGLPALVP